MLVTLVPIVTLVRLEQLANASIPMLATLSGIVTLVRAKQLPNVSSSMLLTLSGIVTLVKAQEKNAPLPMLVTLKPIEMLVML